MLRKHKQGINKFKNRNREKPGHEKEPKLWRGQCWASPPPDGSNATQREEIFVREKEVKMGGNQRKPNFPSP